MSASLKKKLSSFVSEVICVPPLYFLLVGEIIRGNEHRQTHGFPPEFLQDISLYNTTKKIPVLMLFWAYPLRQFLLSFPGGLEKLAYFLKSACKGALTGQPLQLNLDYLDPPAKNNESQEPSLYQIATQIPTGLLTTMLVTTGLMAMSFPGLAYYSLGINGAALVFDGLFDITPPRAALFYLGLSAGITNFFLYWYGNMNFILKKVNAYCLKQPAAIAKNTLYHSLDHDFTTSPSPHPSQSKLQCKGSRCQPLYLFGSLATGAVFFFSLYNASKFPKNAMDDALDRNITHTLSNLTLPDPTRDFVAKHHLNSIFTNTLWIQEALLLMSFSQKCFFTPLDHFFKMQNRQRLQYAFYKGTVIGCITLCLNSALPWPWIYLAIGLNSNAIESYLFPHWPQYSPEIKKEFPKANGVNQPSPAALHLGKTALAATHSTCKHMLARLFLLLAPLVVFSSVFSGISIALGSNDTTNSAFLDNIITSIYNQKNSQPGYSVFKGIIILDIITLIAGANMLGLTNIVVLLLAIPAIAKEFASKHTSEQTDSLSTSLLNATQSHLYQDLEGALEEKQPPKSPNPNEPITLLHNCSPNN